jgi:hypothetical protein
VYREAARLAVRRAARRTAALVCAVSFSASAKRLVKTRHFDKQRVEVGETDK